MKNIEMSARPESFDSGPLRGPPLRKSGRAHARGMTLIEIMVVLVILGMIAAAVAVNVVGQQQKAELKQARTDVQHIADAGVDAYRVMKGHYPSTEEGIRAIIQDGFLKSNQPDGTLKDPWGQEYIYLYPGQKHADGFDVRSSGPDRKAGTEDDIVNF